MKKSNFWKRKTKKEKNLSPLKEAVEPSEAMENKLSYNYGENLGVLKNIFEDCTDAVFREFKVNNSKKGTVIFIDGMVNSQMLGDEVIKPLILPEPESAASADSLLNSEIFLSQSKKTDSYTDVVNNILFGNAVLIIENDNSALILNVRGGQRRGVQEPATEAAVRGPREGFNENLRTNTSLLRFKLKSPKLKSIAYVIGEHTQTNVNLFYVDGLIDQKVLEEVKKRLSNIKIDGVLESGYLEELIEDDPYSPFPQLQYTERPDTVAGHLLEGHFAIFVDGTPFVLIGPVSAWQMLHASEDYYERFFIANFVRWIRFAFLFVALFTPSLYIAVITFHQDMLPTTLILSVAAAREAIPFPAIVEALIMELSFEALREASVRLPKTIGQSVSILGALVIGQAAVEAGIVSAPMVIIVSMTGIASFTIPRFNFSISIRLLRFPLMFLAAAFGLFGIIVGVILILVHLCHLRSFGVPYLAGIAPYKKGELKDIIVRAPWWKMITRPSSYAKNNRERMKEGMNSAPKSTDG